MKQNLLLTSIAVLCFCAVRSQNVFNPADPFIRWNAAQPVGSAQNPNPAKAGLQKWVSVPTVGVSTGGGAFDASDFKSYYVNLFGRRIPFRLKFPRSYTNPDSAGKRYPVMLFFHGAGETGCPSNGGVYNNEKQLLIGGKLFKQRVDNNQFDGFLLYPQVIPPDSTCWGSWGANANVYYNTLIAVLDSMVKYARVDLDRVVPFGLSAGGSAAWRIAEFFPQHVAAIAPSAAAGIQMDYSKFVHIPVWLATGGKDTNPSPAAAQYSVNQVNTLGGYIRYTPYPDLGHAVWVQHWLEADFIPFMNQSHKANPHVFFQRDEFCPNTAISAKLGVTPGFYAYEWQKDNVTIATRTNATNQIINGASIISFTGNEITVKAYGTYRVRYKRTATSAWSVWSPKPAVIKTKAVTQTSAITIDGTFSKVLPSPDGKTTVPLKLKDGYVNYQWYRSTDNVLVGSQQTYTAPVGSYKATYAEPYGCGSTFSPVFTVVNANGSPKPEQAKNVSATSVSQTSVQVKWTDNPAAPYNETGYEIYRATKPGGPYQFMGITAANATQFTDQNLDPNHLYYYIVRAVNNTGAAAPSVEVSTKTLVDLIAPSSPSKLEYRGSNPYSVSLRWNASTDNIGVKRYDIYANGVKMFSTLKTEHTVTGLDANKWYSFTVKAVDGAGNESAESSQVTGYTHAQGFNYKYYHGTWTALPNFSVLTPVKSGTTDTINVGAGLRTQGDNFGFMWDAYIYIPVNATYTFETYSDAGSKLYTKIAYSHGAAATVNNDGVHTAISKTGAVALTRGYHKITVTFFETTGVETLQLYWSNNAGLTRERIPKNFFSRVNVAAGAAPVIPASFTAAYQPINKIKLSWLDKSTNETGFEITRSTTSNGTYLPVTTTTANQTSFIDSALNPSTTYFYRIRSVNANGESTTLQASAATPAPAPTATPVAPINLEAMVQPQNKITLTWVDKATNETGYQVWRSLNNSSYSLIATLPANTNAYTDINLTPSTRYYYYVVGVNGNGTGTKSAVVSEIAGNNAPVIGAIPNIFVKSNVSAVSNFTVTDHAADIVTVSIKNRPSFITLQKINATSYRITATPTVNNVGWYTLEVIAEDNRGGVSSKSMTVAVADKNTRSVYVKFGTKAAPLPWNNWLGVRAVNQVISNLKDEKNLATTFSITSLHKWSATTELGHITGNNSGVVPDTILHSALTDTATLHQFRVGGLNTSMRYNIVFVASHNEGTIAKAQYVSGAQQSTLDARYNTNQTANLNGLIPNASGQITVNINKLSPSTSVFLNAIIIEEYAPSIAILHPANLYAEPIDRSSVMITWSDRSANEAPASGYQLVRATDSLFTQGVYSLLIAGNATSYKNTGLAPNTKYWYRLRARTAANQYSEFSNAVKAVTPASTVAVNFNFTVPNAPYPWNNTVSDPTAVRTFPTLINQSGIVSGLSLAIEKVFNGEFNAGMNTGNNSGAVPDRVLNSAYWLDKQQLSQIRVSGLNHSKRYRFGFTGSSGPNGWFKGNYTATYTINDRTVYLNSWSNTTKVVYIDDVRPDENGEVMLNFSTTNTAVYGFNSGVIIEEYNEPQAEFITSTVNRSNDDLMVEQSAVDSVRNERQHADPRIYPNPFKDFINIDFYNADPGKEVGVYVYDLSGRLLHSREFRNLPQGNQSIRLNTLETNIGTGVFMVMLKSGDKVVKVNKLMRIK